MVLDADGVDILPKCKQESLIEAKKLHTDPRNGSLYPGLRKQLIPVCSYRRPLRPNSLVLFGIFFLCHRQSPRSKLAGYQSCNAAKRTIYNCCCDDCRHFTLRWDRIYKKEGRDKKNYRILPTSFGIIQRNTDIKCFRWIKAVSFTSKQQNRVFLRYSPWFCIYTPAPLYKYKTIISDWVFF